jgi:Spy/CpxP family protein refolding chaperone
VINHIRVRTHLGRILGLGALTVALVISAADRSIATSGTTRSGVQAGASAGRQNPSARQDGQRSSQPRLPWWKDPAVIKELKLTADQTARIDSLSRKRELAMAGAAAEHKKQQDELIRLMEERKVGPDIIGLQVDRVEAQRTTLNKSWTVMLYQFSLILTPEQNVALKEYRDRTRRSDR